MNQSIFKAYDIRGKHPEEINGGVVEHITLALGSYFKSKVTGHGSKVIVVGHDARLSSPKLYGAALRGIMNKESRIKNIRKPFIIHNSSFVIHAAGMITTPMLYFLVNKLNAVGGIMITASHNPPEYNGMKVVGPRAEMISGMEIKELVSL